MSDVLIKTRCTKGHLIVYDDKVSIENRMLGVNNIDLLTYNQITGVQIVTKLAAIPFLSSGVYTVKIFGAGSQQLVANLVKGKDALKAKELIEARLGNYNISQNTGFNDLEKLDELRQKGIITQEEFDAKKKQILSK